MSKRVYVLHNESGPSVIFKVRHWLGIFHEVSCVVKLSFLDNLLNKDFLGAKFFI